MTAVPIRLLVVDDVPDTRRLVRIVLEDSGVFEVVGEAGDGVAGVTLAARMQPDLTLLDLSMPGGGGLDTLPRLLEAAPNTRVVVYSGFDRDRAAQAALDRGASAYVQKGAPPNELVDALLDVAGQPDGDAPPRLLAAETKAMVAAKPASRILIEAAPDAMVLADAEGVIRLVNRRTEELFGYPREELIGESVEVLLPFSLRARHVGHRGSYALDPRVRPMGAALELSARRRDGSSFPVEVSLSPLETDSGLLVSAAVRDVSERQRAEDALKATAAELARSNAELEQFAAVVSHDLREPLRAIKGFTDLLARRNGEQLDERGHELVGYTLEAVARMDRLIRELLDYARLDAGPWEPQPVDCGALVQAVLTRLAPVIEQAGGEIKVSELPTISGNAHLLERVFENLIANALKFVGDAPPVVRISATREPTAWRFSVDDNGIGVDPAQAPRLFAMFSRLHSSEEFPGTGVGLAISRRAVERHGGEISVESSADGGSRFSFTVPDEGIVR